MGFQLMELNGEADNFPERGGLPLTRRSRKEIYWFVISLALAAASRSRSQQGGALKPLLAGIAALQPQADDLGQISGIVADAAEAS